MNASASECSSGCESGWTPYLEHSFVNYNASHRGTDQFNGETDGFYEKDRRAQEEEDLSMVSDASSGPPHFPDDEAYFNEEENGGFYPASKAVKPAKSGGKKRQKDKENQHHKDQQHLPSFLHDTASSCVFDFSKNEVAGNNRQTSTESMLDYSQGFSANYFKGRSSFHQHNDFLQSSLSENELQGNKLYGGKEIGMR